METNQQQRIENIKMLGSSVALLGSIAGVVYSHKTGGGFWRGVGYWIIGGVVFGTVAYAATFPTINKILKESATIPETI